MEQQWDNETILVDGTICGTKPYNNLKDRNNTRIFNCVRETVVRVFLKKTNTEQFVAKLESIQPQPFFDYLLKIPLEKIQNDFFNVCSEVQQYIRNSRIETVKLLIEKGEANVRDAVTDDAFSTNKQNCESMIQDIFSVLNQLHSVGVVHADIKPENFLFCKRANRKTLVLNDFDTSFVIPQNRTYLILNKFDILGTTPRYAAPEQYGIDKYIIGFHTDVFSASMIAYTMLNGNKHPKQYHILDQATKYDITQKVTKLFTEMKKNNTEFTPCERGNPQLRENISKGLRINPDARPSALKIASSAGFSQSKPEIQVEIPQKTGTTKPKTETKSKQAEENKPMNESKNSQSEHNQSEKNVIKAEGGSSIHINQGGVLISLVVVVAFVVIFAIAKSDRGDNNMNVSVSSNIQEDANKPEISTEYITTLSSVTTTEAGTDTILAETEKKTILLQQL